MAAEIKLVLAGINPSDLSKNACQLQVAPVSNHSPLPGKVGEIESRLYALQFDTSCIDALVGASPGALEGNGDAAFLTAERHPPYLHVAKKNHPIRSPVLQ